MAKKGYFSAENPTWRELPSGYTQVTYIEATGTQHLDTRFKPNQNTRIVAKAYFPIAGSNHFLYGARKDTQNNTFCFSIYNTFYRTHYNKGWLDFDASISYTTPFVIDKNKNVTTLNGEHVITHTAASFSCPCSLVLFAVNSAGTIGNISPGRLEIYQIYDNDTLVRDYVACINPSGEVGLYDMVDGVFEGNAGTGSFIAGEPVHREVAREPKKVYFSDNGVARKAKKAYYGDENGIARLCHSNGLSVGDLAVGGSVYMNVGGARTEFLVVHHGLPSAVYDDSCNGTWLLMKDIYEKRAWDSTNNDYKNSDIHSYLNNTFVNLFDSNIVSLIKQVKIPYTNGTGNAGSVVTGANGLSTKVFLPSEVEVFGYGYRFVEGAFLDWFSTIPEGSKDRLASFNGKNSGWWLRTPNSSYNSAMHIWLDEEGFADSYSSSVTYSDGIRPALILPSSAMVDENFNVIG